MSSPGCLLESELTLKAQYPPIPTPTTSKGGKADHNLPLKIIEMVKN